MKKFEKRKKKLEDLSKKPLFWMFVINLILIVYCLVLNTPYNETNDDTGMRALASGSYGDSGGFLVFINIIIGKFLTVLYAVLPNINWYTTFEILIVLISFTLLGILLIDKLGSKYGFSAYLLMVGIFYSEFLPVLQFTRISIMIGIIGYLYIFNYLLYKEKKWHLLVGFLSVWMCLLIRQSSFNIVTLYAAVIGACLLLLDKCLSLSKMKSYVVCFSVLFAVSIAFVAIDTVAYTSNHEWKEYKEFTKLRSKLADYGFPLYEENRDTYEKMGIDRNDYQLYSSGILLYEDTLNIDQMKELTEIKEKEPMEVSKRDLVKTMLYDVIIEPYFMVFIGGTFLFFLINKKSKYWILYIANFLLYIGLFTYFYCIGRVVARVMIPTTFMFALTAVYCFDKNYIKTIRINKTLCVTSVLVFILMFHGFFQKSLTTAKENEIKADELFDAMEDKSKIYFADFSTYRFNYKYFDAYHDFGKDYFSNQINTGGWLSRTPTIDRGMEQLGISNLSSLLTKDNTYLYTSYNEDLYRNFLESHYTDKSVSYSIVDYFDTFKIIKYTTPKKNVKFSDSFTSKLVNHVKYNEKYDAVTFSIKTDIDLTGKKAYINYVDKKSKNLRSFVIEGEYIKQGENNFDIKAIIPKKDVLNKGDFYPVFEIKSGKYIANSKELSDYEKRK